jgi:hypothetical protein
MIISLDDLQEKCRAILHIFAEDLQQVAIVIKVYQDIKFLNLKPDQSGTCRKICQGTGLWGEFFYTVFSKSAAYENYPKKFK